MEKRNDISMAVIRRLPKYHRYLKELVKNNVERISSRELSEKIGFTASQIRQDLNNFGDFGQQGYGYNVKDLFRHVNEILGLDKNYNTIIIGGGNIGQAIANYMNFQKLGFELGAIFDANPKLVGLKIRDVEIRDVDLLEGYLDESKVDIAILCVPKNVAQSITDKLVKHGVSGIWNFAPIDLEVPEDIKIENAHLSDSLLTLSCLMNT